MANISRSRSRSVSTAPLTRATGLPVITIAGAGAPGLACWETAVGAWEATCAQEAAAARKTSAKIVSLYFISSPRNFLTRKNWGESCSLPRLSLTTSRRWFAAVPPFISFASPPWHWRQNCAVWLEPGGAAGRVVGSANEEHRRVVCRSADRTSHRCVTFTTFIRCWLWQVVHVTTGVPL